MWKKYFASSLVVGTSIFMVSVGYIFAASLDNLSNGKIESRYNTEKAGLEDVSNRVYFNKEFDFSLLYPDNYIIYQEGENFVQFIEPKYQNIEGAIPSIMVTVRDNKDNVDLADWFHRKTKFYVGNRNFDQVKNSGVSVLHTPNKQAATITFSGMGEIRTTVIRHKSDIIEFTAHSLVGFEQDSKLVNAYNFIIDGYDGHEHESE